VARKLRAVRYVMRSLLLLPLLLVAAAAQAQDIETLQINVSIVPNVPTTGAEAKYDTYVAAGYGPVCSEPLQAPTAHFAGNLLTLPWHASIDFDDSPITSDCSRARFGPPNESYAAPNGGGWVPILATDPEIASALPSGHSLTRLLEVDNASGPNHVSAFSLTGIPAAPDGFTRCSRQYLRWNPDTEPIGTTPGAQKQQKIMTDGGAWPDYTNNLQNIQISVVNDQDGIIATRFDGEMWMSPPDFQGLYSRQDCYNNLCRFEICIDYSALGELRARLRQTVISPGVHKDKAVGKPVGRNLLPTYNISQSYVFGWFPQNITTHHYATHLLSVTVPTENRNFWIGTAAEVEGGLPAPNAMPTVTGGESVRTTSATWQPTVSVSDADGPNPLTYSWVTNNYDPCTISGGSTLTPTFTFQNAAPTECDMRLNISDGVNTRTVTVTGFRQ
jgi:hypothetical protein